MKHFLITLLLLISSVTFAKANGYGLKYDKPVGDYIVNVDTDVYTLTAGEPVRFNFQLWNKDRTQTVDADSAWVRITQDGSDSSFFAGQIGKPDFGGMGLTYIFAKPGNYQISVRFQKAAAGASSENLAEASFPLTIEGEAVDTPQKINLRNLASIGFLGLVIGAAGGYLLGSRKKRF